MTMTPGCSALRPRPVQLPGRKPAGRVRGIGLLERRRTSGSGDDHDAADRYDRAPGLDGAACVQGLKL
jgi:hypothetical protein